MESVSVPNASAKDLVGSAGRGGDSTSTVQKSRILTNLGPSGRGISSQLVDTPGGQEGSPKGTPRDNGSRANSGRRSTSRCTPRTAAASTPVAVQRRQLESRYSGKKKRYAVLKKELADKQKSVLEFYEDMSRLRDEMIAIGARDPGKVEVEVTALRAGPNEHFRSRDGRGERPSPPRPGFASDFALTMESQLREICNGHLELCREALEKLSDVLTWLAETREDPEIAGRLEVYRMESATLRTRLEETTETRDELISEFTRKIAACCERETRKLRDELDAERDKNSRLKEHENALDAQLRKARSKIKEVESRACGDAAKMQQLRETVESLDSRNKLKESRMEQQAKDMRKALKSKEGLHEKIEKQRESLESRLIELKKEFGRKESEMESAAEETSRKLKAIALELDGERSERQRAEADLAEMRERNAKLEEKSRQLCELAEKAKDFALTDGGHTDNEIRLFDELRTVREALLEREAEVGKLQREKEDIIATMHRAADGDDVDAIRNRVAADLLAKTNQLQYLAMEHDRLRKDHQVAQDNSEKLREELATLQNRLRARSKEGGQSGLAARVVQLEQEVADLRGSLAEETRLKEKLERAATRSRLELELRDRALREREKVSKARDELMHLLHGKEHGTENNGDDENDRGAEQVQLDLETLGRLVNQQIAARKEELQDLRSTLECKQLQVMQLEKLVEQMTDEETRAQAQRTRLEERIARLEFALREKNKDSRYVEERISLPRNSSSPVRKGHAQSSPPEYTERQTLLRPIAPPMPRYSPAYPRSFSPLSTPHQHPRCSRAKTSDGLQPTSAVVSRNAHASRASDGPTRTRGNGRRWCARDDYGSPRESPTRDADCSDRKARESFYVSPPRVAPSSSEIFVDDRLRVTMESRGRSRRSRDRGGRASPIVSSNYKTVSSLGANRYPQPARPLSLSRNTSTVRARRYAT